MAISDLLLYAIPEEMKEMKKDEMSALFSKEEWVPIRNEEKHTILMVGCMKRPLLIGKNASLEDSLRTTEKKIQKKLSNYENKGYGSKLVDGETIPVFAYQYVAQGKKQIAKYGLYSTGKYYLAFSYICGEGYEEYAEQKYDEFLSTIKFNR